MKPTFEIDVDVKFYVQDGDGYRQSLAYIDDEGKVEVGEYQTLEASFLTFVIRHAETFTHDGKSLKQLLITDGEDIGIEVCLRF